MKNIIKFSYYSILVFLLHKSEYNYAYGLGDEARILGESGEKGLGALGEKLGDAIKEKAGEVGSEAAKVFGSDAAEKLAPFLNNSVKVLGIASCGYTLYKVYGIGKDIYDYNHPSEEEKKRENEAREKNEIIDSKRNFRSCLMKNARGKRDSAGLPVDCQELGKSFSMLAGKVLFDNMAETFKETYKE